MQWHLLRVVSLSHWLYPGEGNSLKKSGPAIRYYVINRSTVTYSTTRTTKSLSENEKFLPSYVTHYPVSESDLRLFFSSTAWWLTYNIWNDSLRFCYKCETNTNPCKNLLISIVYLGCNARKKKKNHKKRVIKKNTLGKRIS